MSLTHSLFRLRGGSLPRALVLFLLASSPMLTTEALGQGVADEAEVLFELGAKSYEQGQFSEALLHFMQSNRLSPNSSVAINIGHTYTAMEQFSKAYSWYLEGKALGADAATVDKLLGALEGSVVLLTVESSPPGADIFLNRRNLGTVGVTPATIALAPGQYKVILDKEAHSSFESGELNLETAGESSSVVAELAVVTGRVSITGDDGATVHVGDESAAALCTVPCDIEVPIGRQLLYYKKPGYRSQPSLVEVTEGRTSNLNTELVLITGSVRVETADPGALVEVDGQPAGFTPAIVTGVPAGQRTVRVSREGAVAQTVVVDVPKDGQIDLGRLTLTRTNEVQSASRYAEDIFEAPASISVIRKEELDAFRFPTLVDSLRGTRGVHAQGWYGTNAVGTIGIRGLVPIPAVDPGQRTRFLRDGLVMETQTNSFGIQSQRAQEVQSIEIQRGAGSVLYGTGAISGIVSVFTTDRVRESTAEVEASVMGREAQGRAFLGLGDEELGGWVSVNGFNLAGMDFTLKDVPQTDINGVPLLDTNGDPVLSDVSIYNMQPSSGVTVETKAWAKDLELRYAHIAQQGLLNYGVSITPQALWNENSSDTQRHLLDLVYKPNISDAVSLDSRVYAQSHHDSLNLVSGLYTVDRYNTDQWGGAEARLFIDPVKSWREDDDDSRRLRFSLGAEYHLYPTAENDQTFDIPIANETNIDLADENDMSVLATYALVDVRPVKAFALSAGGRVDQWNQKQDDFVQFNPRIVGMLFPTDNDVVKVIAGRGFRVGDISERLTRTPTLIALPGPIEPETAWTGEVELRHRFDNDWSVLVSAWQASIEGLIEQRPVTDPTNPDFGLLESQNASNARIRGIDAEVQRSLRGGWMLTAWYSRQNPTSALIGPNGESEAFQPLPGAPEQQAAAKVIIPLGGGPRLATRIIYEGRRRLTGAVGYTEEAVLADVVVSGRVLGDAGNWFAGVYNVTSREFALPASTSTFVTVVAPEYRKPLLRAGVELKGRMRKKSELAAQLAAEPIPDVVEPVVEPEVESPEATPSSPPVDAAEPATMSTPGVEEEAEGPKGMSAPEDSDDEEPATGDEG